MLNSLLVKLRDPDVALTPADYSSALTSLPRDCHAILEIMAHDLVLLDGAAPARRELLQLVSTREELTNGDVDPSAASLDFFNRRLTRIRADFVKQQSQLQTMLEDLEKLANQKAERPAAAGEGASISIVVPDEGRRGDEASKANGDPRRKAMIDLFTQLSFQLAELSLTQARCRVETVTLVPVQLGTCEALQIARQNRLDWMNARAALVDSWRQIEVDRQRVEGRSERDDRRRHEHLAQQSSAFSQHDRPAPGGRAIRSAADAAGPAQHLSRSADQLPTGPPSILMRMKTASARACVKSSAPSIVTNSTSSCGGRPFTWPSIRSM